MCCACLQAELQEAQHQLEGMKEAHTREAGHLQAQLRQLRMTAQQDARSWRAPGRSWRACARGRRATGNASLRVMTAS